jgi:hypothetical protein
LAIQVTSKKDFLVLIPPMKRSRTLKLFAMVITTIPYPSFDTRFFDGAYRKGGKSYILRFWLEEYSQ